MAYVARASVSLNLRIDGFHITQSVQTYNRAVSLVAGRGGFLRVFVLANQANTVAPEVRARFYRSGTLVQTLTIAAPTGSVPDRHRRTARPRSPAPGTPRSRPRCSRPGSTWCWTWTRPT